MSGNVAVIYCDYADLITVAEAFADQAAEIASEVRLLRLPGGESGPSQSAHPHPQLRDLKWADGIGFGTPTGDGTPAPELMRFIESTQPLWSSGTLSDKATTVFTDEPERMAPESLLHPIHDTLYKWGSMIIGLREFELEDEARPDVRSDSASRLSAARLSAARYRAFRLARVAGELADDHVRRSRSGPSAPAPRNSRARSRRTADDHCPPAGG
jgi:multimeric flavodoxin WrbA